MHFEPRNFDQLLISVDERHARNILSGRKDIELRRRKMHVATGSRIWIYASLPCGAVVGYATISALHDLTPSTMWRRFGHRVCISRREFREYFREKKRAFAIELEDVTTLPDPIPLSRLRTHREKFQPPQFYMKLASDSPVIQSFPDIPLDTKRKLRTHPDSNARPLS